MDGDPLKSVLSRDAIAMLVEFLLGRQAPECTALARYWYRNRLIPNTIEGLLFLDCQGRFDSVGRWYPDDAELRECCHAVRRPSRRFPFSLLTHALTLKHCCRLDGADFARVSRAKRLMDRVMIDGVEDYTPLVEALIVLGTDGWTASDLAVMLSVMRSG